MLSKLKYACSKAFSGIKGCFKKALPGINKLKMRERNLSIKKVDFKGFFNIFIKVFKILKSYDYKKIPQNTASFFVNLKDRIVSAFGSDKNAEFVKNLGYGKLSTISAGVLCFMVVAGFFAGNFNFGYSVVCSGEVVAVTESKKDAIDAYNSAKEDLKALGIENVEDVKISFVVSNEENFQSLECAKNAITAVYDGRQDAYGIYADGVFVTAVATGEEAELVLENYKKEFVTENTEEVTFTKNVEVLAARIPKNSVISTEAALDVLKLPAGGLKIHTVSEGETMFSIAEAAGTSVERIEELNPGVTADDIQIGAKLNISDTTPVIAVKTKESQTEVEKIAFETNEIKDSTQYKGIKIVVSDGELGEKEVSYDVYRENGIVTEKIATAESVLKDPVAKQVKVGTKERPKHAATGSFRHPFSAGRISSRYGLRSRGNHGGLDLAGATGSSVIAADGGTISFAGWSNGYGKLIKIDHGNGYVTYYAHLSSIDVSNGQKVAKGEHIGKVGNTGRSTGPHLHFEIRLNGKTLNPENYIY